ncbi:hypothetical protein M8J77_021237 [Diaphorina citri]|nr:hypothetical protein M8J77_021237 [Diaphorina citri]
MDLEIQRLVYRTKHPERRQQYNIRIPFIDETESWAYEIIYLFETYLNVMFICLYSVYVTLFPVIITHFCAQYEILCKYLVMLGEEHRDSDGNVIFYSNIERNEFSIKMYKSLKQNRTALKKELVKQEDYEINYLRQIINFHQKLLGFQDELINLVSPLALGILIANNILFSLCLYQMVVNPTKLSQYRLFKFIAEFIAVTIEHFLILNTSEQVDDCNVLMRQAITNSGWHKCTNRTRRDICMLLRRVQIPNYLKCTGGAIVASRIFFLKLVKLSYSFVNFMRLKSIEQ